VAVTPGLSPGRYHDGRLLATGDLLGNIILRNAAGQPVRRWREPHGSLMALALSPDGKVLASADKGGVVTLWRTEDGQELSTLKANDEKVIALAFSPDGTILACGGKSLRLWDVARRKAIKTWAAAEGNIESIAFTPDGKTLASASGNDGRVWLWDVAGKKKVGILPSSVEQVSRLAFSPDGRTLALTSYSGDLQLWDVESRKLQRAFKAHRGWVSALAFTPDGNTLVTVATAPGQGLLKVWDCKILEERAFFRDIGGICSLAVAPDGKTLYTGCFDKTLKLWGAVSDGDIHAYVRRLAKEDPNNPARQTDLVLACWAKYLELHKAGRIRRLAVSWRKGWSSSGCCSAPRRAIHGRRSGDGSSKRVSVRRIALLTAVV
jgi:WD40 repeat protein